MSALQPQLLDVLVSTLRDEGLPTAEVTADTHLFDQAGVDSLLLISFLLAVEAELQRPIDFEALDFRDLTTVRSLATVLENAADTDVRQADADVHTVDPDARSADADVRPADADVRPADADAHSVA
ncbi:acyl carrier protein [Streptomyces sp. NPDC091272]|uniref:acyl carrier protein n=1 Tax=Streptomyces sp. NPDC091272 TaxID=3365981 RepID=UPI0038273770